jgi:hypothetical protein
MEIRVGRLLLDDARLGERDQEAADRARGGGIAVLLGDDPLPGRAFDAREPLVAGARDLDRRDLLDLVREPGDEDLAGRSAGDRGRVAAALGQEGDAGQQHHDHRENREGSAVHCARTLRRRRSR